MRCGLAWWLGMSVVACGGSQAPPRPQVAAVETPQPETERRPYGEVASSVVGSPESPGMWLRVGSPKTLWPAVPTRLKRFATFRGLHDLTNERDLDLHPALTAVIDWSQPVDVVADSPIAFAHSWSFRVRSPEQVMRGSSGLLLRRVSAGVWEIGGLAAPAPEVEPAEEGAGGEEGAGVMPRALPGVDDAKQARACRLHHLPAPVGYRIVCGITAERRDQDTAFLLSRPVERGSDLHVALSGPGYREMREGMIGVMGSFNSDSQPSERELPSRVMAALLEHEQLTFDVAMQGARGKMALSLAFPEKLDSPLFASWLELASKAPLPESLGRLPDDANLVVGLSGMGDAGMAAWLEAFDQGGDVQLSARDEAERKASLSGLFPADGKLSMAAGHDLQAALAAVDSPQVRLADETDTPLLGAANAQLQEAFGGWQVFGIEAPADRYLAAVRRYYRSTQLKGKPLPLDESRMTRKVLMPPAPAGLPATTVHFVYQFRPVVRRGDASDDDDVPSFLPYDQHLLFVPDGARVWLVSARTARLAAEVARKTLAGGARVAGRSELVATQGKPTAAMIWLDPLAMFLRTSDWNFSFTRAQARELLLGLNRAPMRGKARIPIVAEVLRTSPAAGYTLRLVSEGAFADFFADIAATERSPTEEIAAEQP